MEEADFWDDQTKAHKTIAEVNQLRSWTLPYKEIKERFENVESLLPEAAEMGDEALIKELVART